MSIRSHDGRTNDQRRRRVAPAAGFGVVAAGAVAAALLSAAVAPAASATPDVDPFQDFFGTNPVTAYLDTTFNNDFALLANLFDGYVDDPSTIPNVGVIDPPGAEPDPFEDLLGNGGEGQLLDTVFQQYSPGIAAALDAYIDANPIDNDALGDLTQAFGATGGAYIAELEQLITGVPVTDSLADMVIASMGLGPF